MNSWKKRMVIGGAVILALLVGTALLKLIFVNFVVDFWWFQSQGLGFYFFMRHLYRYLVFAFFAFVFFAFFFVNFWIASRFTGLVDRASDEAEEALANRLHKGMQRFYLPLSALMALPIAIPMYLNWEKALMFLFGRASGVSDPLLGKDISFYLFSLPIYTLLQEEILLVAVVLFLGILFLYWYEHRMLAETDASLPRGARVHLSCLGLLIVAVLCWRFLLERYALLYNTANMPVFFGPGYVEMRVTLPIIWSAIVFLAATGIALVVSINRGSGWKLPAIFGLLFALSIVGKNADFAADGVRKYVVAPNQIARERPYIDANIRSTLAAFDLDTVESRDYAIQPKPEFDARDPDLIRRLQNIPVWDREMLGNVYEELQGIRTYYSFPTIDVDRYTVENSYRQVYLGAREIQFSKLPQSAQIWINLHLHYTHGHGLAMIPAAQAGDAFMTWFVKDIPPTSEFGLSSGQNAIYYGLENKPYVIVPNDAGEIGSPVDGDEVIVNYNGTGGVRLNSLWRKLLFAMHFKDLNIFFTTKTNDRSRILFRRHITDRITHITPFFKLDEDPYIVMTDDGLFWIQDAYTTADNYPLAPPVGEGYNYIRNAVKIVVDAYNGKVTYYVADIDDPIIAAFRRMYPGVFGPLDNMPEELRKHIRYPQDMFHTQVTVYAKYHQTSPEKFYRQEDIWEFAKMPQGRDLVPAKPYYLTLDLIESGKEDFLLFMPMSPFGRDNLRALMIAGSDGENYGKLFAYRFSREQQVYGPAQVHSLVNQDVVISEQFTLWDQEGSEVILGKMVIEPTGGSLLYIQPVYLQEEGPLKIPQLKRMIMALGDAVVMAPSLEEAAVKLEAELARKSIRRTRPVPEPRASEAIKPPPAGEPAKAGGDGESVPDSRRKRLSSSRAIASET
jgi:uncharacterized protein